ncbi:hypothetical protein, partial [Escherichia coli]|uniref:hypothetical protein n=1 Tax=Escherichia coli TaxID=562 RepID=UPI001FCEC0EA
EKRVFLVILFTSFSGSLVSRIPGAVHNESPAKHDKTHAPLEESNHPIFRKSLIPVPENYLMS